MPKQVLRFLYMAGVFFLLPALIAWGIVLLVAPGDDYVAMGAVGMIRTVFRDQRVPVAIILFVTADIFLWNSRYRLPGADAAGVAGRSDVPLEMREAYDRALALLEETGRIRDKQEKAIKRDLRAEDREELEDTLASLSELVEAESFDAVAFPKRLSEAEVASERHLGPWRKGEFREYAESIGIAVMVALTLRAFVVEAFKIPSGSMIPTLQIGDHLFVNKMAYGPKLPFSHKRIISSMPPKRGDVIVFQFPENPEQDFIKRVIALPGDRLEAKAGHPMINGWPVPNCKVGTYRFRDESGVLDHAADLYVEYLGESTYLTMYDHAALGVTSGTQGPYHVAKGQVMVMGDNRHNSHDSRGWFAGRGGGVPYANIKGRALFVWLSFGAKSKFAWERLFLRVMGKPQLPPPVDPKLKTQLDKCFRDRPPVSATTPPPPGGAKSPSAKPLWYKRSAPLVSGRGGGEPSQGSARAFSRELGAAIPEQLALTFSPTLDAVLQRDEVMKRIFSNRRWLGLFALGAALVVATPGCCKKGEDEDTKAKKEKKEDDEDSKEKAEKKAEPEEKEAPPAKEEKPTNSKAIKRYPDEVASGGTVYAKKIINAHKSASDSAPRVAMIDGGTALFKKAVRSDWLLINFPTPEGYKLGWVHTNEVSDYRTGRKTDKNTGGSGGTTGAAGSTGTPAAAGASGSTGTGAAGTTGGTGAAGSGGTKLPGIKLPPGLKLPPPGATTTARPPGGRPPGPVRTQ